MEHTDAMRKKKTPKIAGFMRNVLAANVDALMELRLPTYGDKISELARRAGMSRSSVQRIVRADLGASLDLIEQIAYALGVTTYQLLLPGLDAARPQQVPGALGAYRRDFQRWKRAGGSR